MSSITTLSYQFHNTIAIFAAATLVIWMAFAVGRLVRVIRVRASYLSHKLVTIRGLGGVLRSLTDLATYSHVNALMNTRQNAAPSRLRHLVVPYVMSQTPEALSMTTLRGEIVLNLSFDVSCQSEVFLLIDFDMEKFKDLTAQMEESSGKKHNVKKLVNDFTDKANLSANLQALVASHSCSGISYVNSIQPGHHDVAISLGALPSSIKSFAVVFVPVQAKGSIISSFARNSGVGLGSNSSSSIRSNREVDNTQNALISSKIDEVPKDNSLRNSEPTFSNSADSSQFMSEVLNQTDEDNLLKWTLGIAVISGKDSVSLPNGDSRTSLSTTETLVVGSNYTLYSVKEVFGWKATAGSDGKNSDGSSNDNGEAKEGEELAAGYDVDCVICLSEKKDVVLLPCRHLCVCRNCLLHIDKCPVCRSVHKEFIVQTNVPVPVPVSSTTTSPQLQQQP